MAFSTRHLVAAGTMAGALVVGGATWAAAQDSPSTTEQDQRSDEGRKSEDQAPRSHEGCRHGDESGGDSSGSNSSGESSGDANTEASAFWS